MDARSKPAKTPLEVPKQPIPRQGSGPPFLAAEGAKKIKREALATETAKTTGDTPKQPMSVPRQSSGSMSPVISTSPARTSHGHGSNGHGHGGSRRGSTIEKSLATPAPSSQAAPDSARRFPAILSLACALALEKDFCKATLDQSFAHMREITPDASLPMLEQLRLAVKDEIRYAKRGLIFYNTQGLLRAASARRKFLRMRFEYRKGRNETFRELYRGEVDFVIRLRAVVEKFWAPLRTAKQAIISANDAKTIFGCFDSLLQLHQEILAIFTRTLETSWPRLNGIGDAILGISAKLPLIYGEYVRNVPAAVDTCNRLQKSNAKFSEFLAGVSVGLEGRLNEVQLIELLPCALNRIAQYEISMQQIADHTEASVHSLEELESVTKAAMFMHKLSEVVQVSFEMSHNRLKVVQTLTALGGPGKGIAEEKDRGFIGEWDVSIVTKRVSKKSRVRKFFLFNDMAVFAKPKSGAEGPKPGGSQRGGSNASALYRPKEIIKLADAQLEPVAHDSLAEAPQSQCFAFSTPHLQCLVVMRSSPEREHILRELEKLLHGTKTTTMVFGCDLHALLKREERLATVPFVVEILCEFLEKRIYTEGLFRVSPNFKEVNELQALFDTGWKGNLSTIERFSAHAAANVLKLFLRDLPEPLIPFGIYDSVMSITEEGEQRAAKLSQILSSGSMPLVHMNLLRYLMVFLHKVATHSKTNLMTERNLAIMFAPNVLRPKLETVESTLLVPRAVDMFETMLVSQELWTGRRVGSFNV